MGSSGILSETPLGRTDYHFWGHAEMRARRGQVHQDLHDFVGPFGWLPSATELQRSGKHRPSDVGMFPTLLGVMTLGGYVLLSVDVDVDKSTRSPDGIVIPTHCLVFGRLGSPEEPPRVLYYTAMERDSLAVQSVSDKLSAHLLQNRLSLAAHLVGAEYGFLGETAQPLRQLVTAVASVVVQDDSGLPFHTLQTSFDSIDSVRDTATPFPPLCLCSHFFRVGRLEANCASIGTSDSVYLGGPACARSGVTTSGRCTWRLLMRPR